MKKPDILIDTNIFLDVFLAREPFFHDSRSVLKLCEEHRINGYITASSLTDLFYILNRGLHDTETVYSCLGAIFDIVRIIPVTEEEIFKAYSIKAADFEDCLISVCAEANGCDAIITRNIKDFADSGIRAEDPQTFISRFH